MLYLVVAVIADNISHISMNRDITNKECDIILNLFKKGNVVKNMRKYGEVRLSLPYLIQLMHPKHSSWGCHVYETNFDVMEYSSKSQSNIQNKIGEMNVTLNMRMQMFPRIRSDHIAVRGDQAPSFHFLFDIIIDKFIDYNMQHRHSRNRFELLTFHQKWLIEEYCNHHGISEIYRKLSLMRLIVRKTDILLLSVNEFRQSIDFVINGVKSKTVIASRKELDMLVGIKDELVKKIEFILAQFITLLDGGSRHVLEVLVELLEYMQTKNDIEEESMTPQEFAGYLESLVSRAVDQDYRSLRKEQIEMCEEDQENICAASLIKLIQLMSGRIEYIIYYSSVIPEYLKFTSTAIRFYYDRIAEDYETVFKLSGFSGYQMLFFCRKLEEYHDEISECLGFNVTKRRNFRTIDIPTISRGYEEKYVQELKSRLVTHIQRAVELETWKPVGEKCLHSQSLVDFFTSANQTLAYMIDVEFMTERILNLYCEAVGDCVVEYAKILQLLCIREILRYNDSKQPTRKSLLNLQNLLNSGTKDDAHREIDITPEFTIKLNNIEASSQQYRHIVKSVTEVKLKNENDDTSDEYDEVTDSEKDDDSSSKDDQSETEKDNHTQVDKEDEDDDIESEKTASIVTKFSSTMNDLNIICDDLISLIALQFEPTIQLTLMRTMQQLKKDTKKQSELTEEEMIDMYGKSVCKSFKTMFLDSVLTPNLATLSENIYHTAFKKILRSIYAIFLKQCEDILMPDISFGHVSHDILNSTQMVILRHLVSYVSTYFSGDGEGIQEDVMAKQRRFINSIFRMSEMSTEKLIELYSKLTKTSGGRSSPIKGYHALSILSTRRKMDKTAAKFIKDNTDRSLQMLLLHEFGINSDAEHQNNYSTSVVSSYPAMNENLKRGKCFLLPNFLLWKPYYGKSTKGDPSFAKKLTAIDRFGCKIKILLNHVRELKPLNPLVGKGIKFFLNDRTTVRIYLETRKARDQLLQQIVQECKKLEVMVTVLEATTKTNQNAHQKNRNITTNNLDSSAINPALVLPKDIAKTLQSRFGITATLIERFSCKCSIGNQDEHGTLYLFDNCFCFDAFGNYSIDASDLIASWHKVDKIDYYPQEMEIVMTFNDGRVVLFYRFLTEMSVVKRCVSQLYNTFKSNNDNLTTLKSSDPKTYFTARFGFKGDALNKSIACSVPGSAFFPIYGVLYIGFENICFEKDNQPGLISFTLKAIQSTCVKSWNWRSNSCLSITVASSTTTEPQVHKFIIPNMADQVEEWLKQATTNF